MQLPRIRAHAMFRGFSANVDLNQYWKSAAELRSGRIQLARELDGVHRIHESEKIRGLCGFIGLQVADHVPFGAGQGEQWARLCGEFLHAIFAEETDAGCVGLKDRGSANGFRHRHQRDVCGIAPSTGCGTRILPRSCS